MLEIGPPQFWHWWALGGLLVIIEAFAPGFALLWLGIAAGLVGLALFVWPELTLEIQFLIFAALSVVSVVGWRWLQKARPIETDQPNLNRRGAQYVGRRIGLVTPIVNGRGRAKLGDSSWTVTGPELPAGETVEVVGVDGVVLEVRSMTGPAPVEAE